VSEFLVNKFKEINIDLSDKQVEQFEKYFELLVEWNKVMNLTAITEKSEVIIKHFVDSLSICLFDELDFANKVNRQNIVRVLDVGTGAGFPGIPLKIVFPSLKVTLLDSLNKRVNFLNTVIDELGLDNIEAIHGRAEDYAKKSEYREQFDLVVSRAVSNLATLSEYCLPYVREGKFFVPYKSQKLNEEVSKGSKAIAVMGGKIIGKYKFILADTDNERSFLYVKKIKKTPNKYPRGGNKPAKEPIC